MREVRADVVYHQLRKVRVICQPEPHQEVSTIPLLFRDPRVSVDDGGPEDERITAVNAVGVKYLERIDSHSTQERSL